MKLGNNGLQLIKDFEGFRENAYPDPGTGGKPITIGFGTTRYPDDSEVQLGDTCTEEEAGEWLRYEVEHKVLPKLEKLLTIDLNQNQLDALISFCYNCGTGNLAKSTLLILTNAGKFDLAANEFLRWNKAAGKVMNGLTRRRQAEKTLFLTT